MSYDCCRKCGMPATEPYEQCLTTCDDAECPQKLRNKAMKDFAASLPVRQSRKTLSQIYAERESLEQALDDAENKRKAREGGSQHD